MKYDERVKRRSYGIAVCAAAGHIVKSGMTVIARWGAIAGFVSANKAAASGCCFFIFKSEQRIISLLNHSATRL